MGKAMKLAAADNRKLKLLACTAVILLCAWIQSRVLAGTEVITPIRADAAKYVSYAWNMRESKVFSHSTTWLRTDARPPTPDKLTLPGYPAFLSLFLEGPPDEAFIARATTAQMLLGVATCWLILMTGLRFLPFWAAMSAGLLTAISPHLAVANTYLLTESLFSFLVATCLYVLVRTAQTPDNIRWHLAAALVLSCASYVRPQLQALPFVLLFACLIAPQTRRYVGKVAVGVALFVALMAPWHLRNEQIERPPNEPDLLATTLYHGSFPQFMYRGAKETRGFPYRFDPGAAEHGHSVDSAVEWIQSEFRRDPESMISWYLFGKTKAFLSWGIVAGMGDVFVYPVRHSPYFESLVFSWLRKIAYWLHGPLMALAIIATFAGVARPRLVVVDRASWPPIRILAICMLVVLVMHILGAPFPRYGIPFRPLCYLLALVPIVAAGKLAKMAAEARRQRSDSKRQPAAQT